MNLSNSPRLSAVWLMLVVFSMGLDFLPASDFRLDSPPPPMLPEIPSSHLTGQAEDGEFSRKLRLPVKTTCMLLVRLDTQPPVDLKIPLDPQEYSYLAWLVPPRSDTLSHRRVASVSPAREILLYRRFFPSLSSH